MSDPFAWLSSSHGGLTPTAQVRQYQHDAVFRAWREFHIAYPQLYVIDRHASIPPPILDDGQPMTPERVAAIMGDDIRPMFTPSPDGDNSKAVPTHENYQLKFAQRIVSEPLGASSIAYRPTVPRYIPPREIELPPTETEVQHDHRAASHDTTVGVVSAGHHSVGVGRVQDGDPAAGAATH